MDDKAKLVYDSMMAKDWFSQWMQIELLEVKAGYCKLKMCVRKEMLNGFGILHGGITFAFADSAFAFASNAHGRLSVSQTATMTYMLSAKEGDYLIAEAKELYLGNRTGTYDVTVSNEEETLVSLFRGSVYRTSKNHLE